jgi:hypothetical protein
MIEIYTKLINRNEWNKATLCSDNTSGEFNSQLLLSCEDNLEVKWPIGFLKPV